MDPARAHRDWLIDCRARWPCADHDRRRLRPGTLRAARADVRCGDDGAGRGRARPRGPRARPGRAWTTTSSSPASSTRGSRRTAPTTRDRRRAGRDALRRLHPGLQPHRRGPHDTADYFKITDNQHNEFEPEHAAARTTRSPTAPRDARRPRSASPRRAASPSWARPRPRCCSSSCRSTTPRTGRSSSRSRRDGGRHDELTYELGHLRASVRSARPIVRLRSCTGNSTRAGLGPSTSRAAAGAPRRRPAGAGADEQHGHRDPRSPRRRVGREPGVGVRAVGRRGPRRASGPRVSSSSAVPVLPATLTPGQRRRRAGAVVHHVDASSGRACARPSAMVTRTSARALARPPGVGSSAHAARRDRLRHGGQPQRGGEHLALSDRGRADLERGADLAPPGGRVLGHLAGHRRAPRSSRSAPRRHEPPRRRASPRAARTPSCTSGRSCLRTCRRRTRRWRSRARRRRSRPRVSTGNCVARLHGARLERRGGGHDLEGRARAAGARRRRCPASARISPGAGSSAAMPPKPPGQRRHRGLLEAGVDRGAHGPRLARLGARPARARRRAARRPGGPPAGARRRARGRSGPRASRAGSRARRGPSRSAARLARAPASRRSSAASAAERRAARVRRPLGQHLAVARTGARRARAALLRRLRAARRPQAGEGEARAPRRRFRRSPARATRPCTAPKTRVRTSTGTATVAVALAAGSPASTGRAWPWRRPRS